MFCWPSLKTSQYKNKLKYFIVREIHVNINSNRGIKEIQYFDWNFKNKGL